MNRLFAALVLIVAFHVATLERVVAAPAEDHWSLSADEATREFLSAAQTYIAQEKYGLALTVLTEAVERSSENADIWNLIGYCQRKRGNLVESGDAYAKALKLDPNHLGALEYQGELSLLLGDLPTADNNFARLKLLCPGGCKERTRLKDAIERYRLKN